MRAEEVDLIGDDLVANGGQVELEVTHGVAAELTAWCPSSRPYGRGRRRESVLVCHADQQRHGHFAWPGLRAGEYAAQGDLVAPQRRGTAERTQCALGLSVDNDGAFAATADGGSQVGGSAEQAVQGVDEPGGHQPDEEPDGSG